MRRAGSTIALAAAVNASLLLGCTALQSLNLPGTNKPAAGGSPTPTPTGTAKPIGAKIGERLTQIPGELKTGANATTKNLEEKSAAPYKAIDAITPAQERALGQASAFAIIQQSGGIVLEQDLTNYVNQVANFVASKGERTEKGMDGVARMKARRFFVGVLESPSMNAYALPGGYILVTRGLVENLSCESDLAWVLGHEIAHVDAEHGLKALKATIGTTAAMREWTGTSGDASFDNPEFFAKVVDRMSDIAYKTGMQVKDERYADAQGLKLATEAGYDSQAPKRVLELLQTNESTGRFKPFQSHDQPAYRIQLLGGALDAKKNGKLGVDRFDRECIARLASVPRASASATSP